MLLFIFIALATAKIYGITSRYNVNCTSPDTDYHFYVPNKCVMEPIVSNFGYKITKWNQLDNTVTMLLCNDGGCSKDCSVYYNTTLGICKDTIEFDVSVFPPQDTSLLSFTYYFYTFDKSCPKNTLTMIQVHDNTKCDNTYDKDKFYGSYDYKCDGNTVVRYDYTEPNCRGVGKPTEINNKCISESYESIYSLITCEVLY